MCWSSRPRGFCGPSASREAMGDSPVIRLGGKGKLSRVSGVPGSPARLSGGVSDSATLSGVKGRFASGAKDFFDGSGEGLEPEPTQDRV
jgi:hypothetical protein